MVTFECFVKSCSNCNVPYNFLGFPETALCGGCGATLEATDPRPDPEPMPFAVDVEEIVSVPVLPKVEK